MKLSYNIVVRIYSFFSILFFIFGALAIIIGGTPLFEGWEYVDPAVISSLIIFRIVVILLLGTGFVASSLLLVITRRKGFVAYNRIIDRLGSGRSMNFNLNISFPEQDEFGNLGSTLNKFMEQVRLFDRLKVERMRALQQQISFLMERMDKGIIILTEENRVDSINTELRKLLNIGDKKVAGLPIIRLVENEEISEALEQIKEKPKNLVLEDLKIKVDETVYKTQATIVPIISSDVELVQTMIIFEYIQKRVLRR
jgi:signal transduction histidine kinase